MNALYAKAGIIAGLLGMLVCVVAGLARLAGFYYLAGFETMTLLNVGVAIMVFAILLKAELIYRKLSQV